MKISEQIALFLHDKGIATYDPEGMAGNVFLQTSPAAPDVAFSIYTTGGPPADRRGVYGKAAVQILIRTLPNDPREGESQAQAVVNALNGFSSAPLTAGGNYVIDTEAQQSGPNNMGQDDARRYEYSQNFIIEYLL